MITEADWNRCHQSHLRPYINHVLEIFGIERVIFGSDWPVCLLAGSYEQAIQALEGNLAQLGDEDKAKVFG
jgi:L-fuconolactonase